MELEAGKYYKTRGGDRVFCVGIDENKHAVISAKGKLGYVHIGGKFFKHLEMHEKDIIEEWAEPRKGTVWVSIYDKNDVRECHKTIYVFKSKEEADFHERDMKEDYYKQAAHSRFGGRLVCIEVPWTEGEGLQTDQ